MDNVLKVTLWGNDVAALQLQTHFLMTMEIQSLMNGFQRRISRRILHPSIDLCTLVKEEWVH
jgi:hypothetical protein